LANKMTSLLLRLLSVLFF